MYAYRVVIDYAYGRPEEVAGFRTDDDARDYIEVLVRKAPQQGWLYSGLVKLINNQTEEVLMSVRVKAGK